MLNMLFSMVQFFELLLVLSVNFPWNGRLPDSKKLMGAKWGHGCLKNARLGCVHCSIFLPMGTLDPVAKWHSCRLRVRIGRWPNISTLLVDGLVFSFCPDPDFAPESPMSMSLTNHFKGLVSTIGEDGVDWMAVNRSDREPNP